MATATEPITYDNISLCSSCEYNKNECNIYNSYLFEDMEIFKCRNYKFKENPFTREYISIWRSEE